MTKYTAKTMICVKNRRTHSKNFHGKLSEKDWVKEGKTLYFLNCFQNAV